MWVDKTGGWAPIHTPEISLFTDYNVRKNAYWSVFEGASGYTYGANDIWQFSAEDRRESTVSNWPMRSWKEALYLSGACQLRYLKKLMMEFDEGGKMTAPELLLEQEKNGLQEKIVVCRNNDTKIFAYTPVEQKFTVDTSLLESKTIVYRWYDPKNGEKSASETAENTGMLCVQSPIGLDYVLIVEKGE